MQVQTHITEVIQEALYRRVKKTIDEYVKKNAEAFRQNKIAGVEWNLKMNVLFDNLGLLPQPRPSLLKRFQNVLKNIFSKTEQTK